MSGGKVRVPVGGMVSGALAGLGVLVILQQSGVLYPTRIGLVVALLGGALVAFVVVSVVAGGRGRGGREASAADELRDPDGWRPTHAVVAAGTAAYDEPGGGGSSKPLDPGLEVLLIERRGDWTQIQCSNGWTAWVVSDDLQQVGARA